MSKKKTPSGGAKGKKRAWGVAALLVVLVALAVLLAVSGEADTSLFEQKAALLWREADADWVESKLGAAPAGKAGHVVFFSVCDTKSRASVYSGTGQTLAEAWDAAEQTARNALRESGLEPVWVKADLVYLSETVSAEELAKSVKAARHEFFRYGTAFDSGYSTALLEAEMNGAKIYEYDDGGIDLEYLNRYLEKSGKKQLKALPETYTLFQCFGWLCDDKNEVYELSAEEQSLGRREVELDRTFVKNLVLNGSEFLMSQVKEDGSFVYGWYPRFDREIENYNVVRHASTIWSLLCRYRIRADEQLAEDIRSTIGYMLTQVKTDSEGRAYLYEEKDDEIKLGGCGMAVVAMTEYMDIFQNNDYQEVCEALGEGILTMLDQQNGTYYHVLNGDFSRKEEFRTVYYDGEATFALCRLYSLTHDQKWLDAAQQAVQHFIDADYAQYKDHWIAYTMNELTKIIPDNPEYYAFALQNAQQNLEEIYNRDTTYHTYLELLMATFETYDRMLQNGGSSEGFDQEMFLKTIYTRADRMLNGYFFPEYAMYMANPQRILNTFMVRHDGYRVRIDDVQHNIGGYYLYYKNYNKLVEYGMLENR